MKKTICPWDHYEQASISFCEEELCAWVTQPANTWSNIFFLIAGYFIIKNCLQNYQQSKKLLIIGFASIFVGIGSFLFHMSGILAFEILDHLGMYFIAASMFIFNLNRVKSISTLRLSIIYVSTVTLSLVINILYKDFGIPVFAYILTMALTLEIFLYCRDFNKFNYKYLYYFVASFLVAFIFWYTDIHKILCDPNNHILNGHAIWHFFNSIAIYNIYQFYRQFYFKDMDHG